MTKEAAEWLVRKQRQNPRVFKASKVTISVASLEEQLVAAFEAGQEAGRNSLSEFERVFGK